MAQYAVAMQMPVLCLSAGPGGWALSFVLAMYLTIPGIKNIGLFKNLDWKVDNTLAIQLSKW
jgi:hypothetical protein